MFLCDDCHARAACASYSLEEAIGPRSRGGCESCRRTASCIDCHGYGRAGRRAEPVDDPGRLRTSPRGGKG